MDAPVGEVYARTLSKGLEQIKSSPYSFGRLCAELAMKPGMLGKRYTTSTAILYDGKGHFKITDYFPLFVIGREGFVDGAFAFPSHKYEDYGPEFDIAKCKGKGFIETGQTLDEIFDNPVLIQLFGDHGDSLPAYARRVFENRNEPAMPIFLDDKPAKERTTMRLVHLDTVADFAIRGDVSMNGEVRFIGQLATKRRLVHQASR